MTKDMMREDAIFLQKIPYLNHACFEYKFFQQVVYIHKNSGQSSLRHSEPIVIEQKKKRQNRNKQILIRDDCGFFKGDKRFWDIIKHADGFNTVADIVKKVAEQRNEEESAVAEEVIKVIKEMVDLEYYGLTEK